MATRKVDFSKTTSDPIPEGIYLVSVDQAVLDVNDKNGNEFLAWRFTIADGDFIGRKLFMNTWLTDKAMFMLVGLLGALGCEPDDANNVEIETDDESGLLVDPDVVGKLCHLKVVVEDYKDREGKVKQASKVKGVVTNKADTDNSNGEQANLF